MAIALMANSNRISGMGRTVTEARQSFTFTRRAMVLGAIQGGIGMLLAGRMAWISIAENEHYELLSESNRVNLTLVPPRRGWIVDRYRSEEHTSELQSLMRISYAVFCLKKKKQNKNITTHNTT